MSTRRRPEAPDLRPVTCPVCARRACPMPDHANDGQRRGEQDWTPWLTLVAANA